MIDQSLAQRVAEHEGFRPKPYLCPAGVATIGHGTSLEAHPHHIDPWSHSIANWVRGGKRKGQALVDDLLEIGMEWNEEKAHAACVEELEYCDRMLSGAIPWAGYLDPVRRGVLIEMAYQMGITGLLRFKQALKYLRDYQNYAAAAEELLDSKWARVDSPERARRLAEIMRRGEE